MKRTEHITRILCIALALAASPARADDAALVSACRGQVGTKFQQWRMAPPPAEVAEYARKTHTDPDVTFGDFDGDGRRDVALLIQHGAHPAAEDPARGDTLHIAVCLSAAQGVRLHLIDKPYCGDGISTSPRGERYYDYDTEKEGTYKHDGVAAFCYEKAGATYEFRGGKFHQIVDSD